MGDASGASTFFQRKKRLRPETEENTLSGTQNTDDVTPPTSTNLQTEVTPPRLLINSEDFDDSELSDTASTGTMKEVRPRGTTDDNNKKNIDHFAFKWDNLNDKKCRYDSHEGFLKKCLENNVIPNGFRVYVEASIGNRDEEFMNWWHTQLEGLSKTLMNGVIGFCEKTVTNAKTEISEAQDQLKEVTTDTILFHKQVDRN